MLSEGTASGASRVWRVVGLLVLLLAAAPIVHRYLVAYPDDQWQVDLQVYREAGRSLLLGRPVYLYETEVPQLLPFTYPTFSAVLSIPLALLPWAAAGWVWTGVQLALLLRDRRAGLPRRCWRARAGSRGWRRGSSRRCACGSRRWGRTSASGRSTRCW